MLSICLRSAGTVRSRVSHAQPGLGLFQVYMFKCVWRCYRLIKHMNSAEEKSSSKILEKVSLAVGGGEPALALPLTLSFGGGLSPLLCLSDSTCKMRFRQKKCEDPVQLLESRGLSFMHTFNIFSFL